MTRLSAVLRAALGIETREEAETAIRAAVRRENLARILPVAILPEREHEAFVRREVRP